MRLKYVLFNKENDHRYSLLREISEENAKDRNVGKYKRLHQLVTGCNVNNRNGWNI